jgi:hypothetical protein
MDNTTIWIILGVVSVIFGIATRINVRKDKKILFWFFEVWRDTVSYFIAAMIGYFFIDVRWSYIRQSGILSTSDFILFLVFIFSILGWWPYVVRNATDGITKIVSRIIR